MGLEKISLVERNFLDSKITEEVNLSNTFQTIEDNFKSQFDLASVISECVPEKVLLAKDGNCCVAVFKLSLNNDHYQSRYVFSIMHKDKYYEAGPYLMTFYEAATIQQMFQKKYGNIE